MSDLLVGVLLLAIGWGARMLWEQLTGPIYVSPEQQHWPPWLRPKADNLLRVLDYMVEQYTAKGFRVFTRYRRQVRVKTREGDTIFLRRPR